MRTVAARRDLPGATVAEAQALWLDRNRWPSFVDGFGRMAIYNGEWPQPKARVVWDSHAGGRGRVVEQVVDFEPGRLLRTRVEDAQLHGTQTVHFSAGDGGAAITLELGYEPKRSGLPGAIADLLVVRRQLRESLRRTLARFAVELDADREQDA